MLQRLLIAFALLSISLGAAGAQQRAPQESAALRAQILLDRARISPGPIDGRMGKNTQLAIRAFQLKEGMKVTGQPSDAMFKRLESEDRPLLQDYELTQEDVSGPFLDEVPTSMQEMAKLDRLSFTGAKEKLGEMFHMDTDFLERLNPGVDFSKPGTTIRVADVVRPKPGKAGRIEVDAEESIVRVYGADDQIIAVYPATVGSSATPSPSGTHKVTRIAKEPDYTYDPKKLAFEGVDATEPFTIPPGPNNPVGLVWIALDSEGYGIHGSPQPEAIRRQASHGCVRLTNWDALDLLAMVQPGIEVAFVSGGETQRSDQEEQRQPSR